jgi:hypothetical protein
VTPDLGLVDAVGASLTQTQLAALQGQDSAVRVHPDRTVQVTDSATPDDGADDLMAF